MSEELEFIDYQYGDIDFTVKDGVYTIDSETLIEYKLLEDGNYRVVIDDSNEFVVKNIVKVNMVDNDSKQKKTCCHLPCRCTKGE